MFPSLLFALFGGSFVFLNVGASILFLVFPLFGCLGLFMVDRVFFFFPSKLYKLYEFFIGRYTCHREW
jgi:hypothetical protein